MYVLAAPRSKAEAAYGSMSRVAVATGFTRVSGKRSRTQKVSPKRISYFVSKRCSRLRPTQKLTLVKLKTSTNHEALKERKNNIDNPSVYKVLLRVGTYHR